ncbi:uncharacterized protein LOC116806504 [Drosophila grimshawi]|uniref:uncharacterized protein LOC116806504 n=1 Tax=Drosophila grimshawi TaxID=7222 RepID=UPI0013EF01E0|nr:uncharacterized protein LOC116806504 [Drosophila grimshawi]
MWVLFTLFLLVNGCLSGLQTRYLNIECDVLDPAYVNLSLHRKFNGYRPFMFNHTYDYCKFMAKGNNKLSFTRIINDLLAIYSNLNHSCPFEHPIIVKDMVATTKDFQFVPLPTGDYKVQVLVAIDNEWRTNIKVYLQWILD